MSGHIVKGGHDVVLYDADVERARTVAGTHGCRAAESLAEAILIAKRFGLDAPVSRLIRERWAAARDQLGPTRDNSEAIKSWDADLQV
jgi:3-hydroxyisobutyrate dehydrogenase-like beta-hydroxyacid dehydrogenase